MGIILRHYFVLVTIFGHISSCLRPNVVKEIFCEPEVRWFLCLVERFHNT